MSQPRTLWILSELYAPELTSTGYFITRIAEHLALDPRRDVLSLASQPTYAARGVRASSEEMLNGVHVRRFWSPAMRKDTLLGRVLNLLAFTIQTAWVLIRKVSAGDTILAVTNPPPLPYLGALAARMHGARFILLVHDMYPEAILAGGFAKPDSLIVRVLDRTSRWLYRTADRVIVLGRDMQRLVTAKLSEGDARHVVIIPNWASLDEVDATPIASRPTNARFTVQHAGNMGRGHNVEILVDAAERLPHIDFTFIGEGAKRAWVEREALARSLPNVRVAGYRPRRELSQSLGDCDVAAIAFLPGMSGVSVPSRMYNVLAAGRPIVAVCTPDSELGLVVSEDSVGWVVAPHDLDGLVCAIAEASRSRTALAARGAAARCVAERKYSEDAIMTAYDQLVSSVDDQR